MVSCSPGMVTSVDVRGARLESDACELDENDIEQPAEEAITVDLQVRSSTSGCSDRRYLV